MGISNVARHCQCFPFLDFQNGYVITPTARMKDGLDPSQPEHDISQNMSKQASWRLDSFGGARDISDSLVNNWYHDEMSSAGGQFWQRPNMGLTVSYLVIYHLINQEKVVCRVAAFCKQTKRRDS